jgi:hypothetical protein
LKDVPDQLIHSRCLDMIASLPVPDPFDLERFRVNLACHRGRPLLLLPDAIAKDCSGIWIGTQEADFIFYARDTSPVHQRHIIAHEIGHMAFGHQGAKVGDEGLTRVLFPDLSPAVVQSFLARTSYSDNEEREAETFASILLGRVRRQPAIADLSPDEAELLHRIERAFTPAYPGYGKLRP